MFPILESIMKNIEIKARCKNLNIIRKILKEEKAKDISKSEQIDTYFNSINARLKLREINGKEFILIQYNRANKKSSKFSDYKIYKTESPEDLKECLKRSLGIKVIVEKIRELYEIDSTRIHLDEVNNLGTFLELETVVKNELDTKKYKQENKRIKNLLGIKNSNLIESSYSDLLLKRRRKVN
ncbi:CYTH domain-containing protein [Candidatus Dojkabacteria bacterium]|nr:CYTH domain-containing protein [Candidatus Dojkabacteria bacterium]